MTATNLRLALIRLSVAALVVGAVSAGCDPGVVACDPACGTGFECVAGSCVPVAGTPDMAMQAPDLASNTCTPACAAPTPHCNAQKMCVACITDEHCPAGTICKSGVLGTSCVAGCTDDARCLMGQKCCGGACADVSKDVRNCGGCGMVCSGSHSQAACANGMCQPGKCETGWGDCNNDPKDGCETNLRSDPNHCTACGMKCAIKNAIAGCSNGCYTKACNFGYDDCNVDEMDGCETSVESDPKNCGGCGKSCPAKPNAKIICAASSCLVSGCNQGFGNCDGDSNNGCEINLLTNAQHCGACGAACGQNLICVNGGCTCQGCTLPGAKTKCVNLQCLFDGCLAGYANCDGNEANGCEVNTNVDNKNCSACGMACPMNLPTCVGGVCQNFRPTMMLWGASSRPITQFYPQNMGFNQVSSCNPDNNTQAMWISRNGTVNQVVLQNYLNNGGIVMTEYNISHTVWNQAFGTNVGQGARAGSCQDTLPSVVQFSPNDPFWQANMFQMQQQGQTGCGHNVGLFPGITPLAGWDANNVAVGYRDLGQGRFWATDFDWQDGEMQQPYAYTQQLMSYMALHRR